MDDVGLVRAAVAGDRGAFGDIYDRYADRVHAFATSVLRDPDEAADVTQDTFLVAARRLDQLRDPTKLRPWLFAIARHEAFRRAKKRRRHVLTDELEDQVSLDAGAEELVTSRDAAGIVQEAAAGLTERDRAVLDLSLRHGLEGEELGAAMGISAGHASVLAGRVRDRVEKSLGALLVARLGRDDCAELQGVLGEWDGSFSPLVRKRVARHVEGCEVCSATKRRVASPAALLASAPVVAAPATLREHVLHAYDTGLGAQAAGSGPGPASADGGAGPADAAAPSHASDASHPSGSSEDAGVRTSDASPSTSSEAGGAGSTPTTTPTPVATPTTAPPTPPIHLDRAGFPRSSSRRTKVVAVAVVLLLLVGLAGVGLARLGGDDVQSVATREDTAGGATDEDERAVGAASSEADEAVGAATAGPPATDPVGPEPGSGAEETGASTEPNPGSGGGIVVTPPPPPPPPPPVDAEPPTIRLSAVPSTISGQASFCPAGPTQSTITAHVGDPSGVGSVSSSPYTMSGGGGTWSTTIGPFIPMSPGDRTVTVTVTASDTLGNTTSRSTSVTVDC